MRSLSVQHELSDTRTAVTRVTNHSAIKIDLIWRRTAAPYSPGSAIGRQISYHRILLNIRASFRVPSPIHRELRFRLWNHSAKGNFQHWCHSSQWRILTMQWKFVADAADQHSPTSAHRICVHYHVENTLYWSISWRTGMFRKHEIDYKENPSRSKSAVFFHNRKTHVRCERRPAASAHVERPVFSLALHSMAPVR